MKRVLAAAALAILVHGFLFAFGSGWLRKRPVHVRGPEIVTLTLAYYGPQKEQAGPKVPGPPKRRNKKNPAFKQRPKKKALKKPRAMEIPERAEKKARPSRATARRDPSRDMREPGLSKEGPPAKGPMVSKRPAGTALKQAIPKYKENPRPLYPRAARRRGYEGITLLEVLVDQEGRVADLKVFQSSGYPVLDRAAKASVRKWVFWPARKGNESIEMWVKIPIRFQLR
ncbi:MAG: energy transducer TonB [Deltaproteobacteria bacterium]|nr:energy transducer TonB [Deltaproteobacteria bacterium]